MASTSTNPVDTAPPPPKKPTPSEIYGLEIFAISRNHLKIYVVQGPYSDHFTRKEGHSLIFEEEDGKKMLTCNNIKDEKVWKTEIDNPKTLFQCAIDHFKNLLRTHHTKIKRLVFCGRYFENVDFEIRSLESLENLEIDGNVEIQQFFFPNSASPLRTLKVCGVDNSVALRNYEETYDVKDVLKVPGLKLSIEEISRLKAPHVQISIGDLTPEEIFAFLKNWQKSTTLNLLGDYQWVINNSNFSLERLFTLLDVYDPYVFERTTNIAHEDRQKSPASLNYADNVLRFSWRHSAVRPAAQMDDWLVQHLPGFEPGMLMRHFPAAFDPAMLLQDPPPGFNPAELARNLPPGFNPAELARNLPPGFNPAELARNLPPGFNPAELARNLPPGFNAAELLAHFEQLRREGRGDHL